jgi:PAS domain S-box-containing protein
MSMKRPRPTQEPDQIGDPTLDRSLRLLCETALEALVVVDDARRYVYVNESATKLFGAPADELVGRRVGDFTPPELFPAFERIWADFERTGAMHGPYEMARGDGSRVLIEYRGLRNFSPGRHLLAAVEIAAPQVQVAGVRVTMRQDGASLTAREREVLQLATRGHSTREIAAVLSLSSATVKTHFQRAYEKLGVRDRASAVAECLRRGLIE